MISDPIGDMLTRIRNAYLARHRKVELPYSKINERLGEILIKEAFIKKMEKADSSHLILTLSYNHKVPAVIQINRVSTPGRRVYQKSSEIKNVRSGLGIQIISTSKGLMTGKEARRQKLGGEVIGQVW